MRFHSNRSETGILKGLPAIKRQKYAFRPMASVFIFKLVINALRVLKHNFGYIMGQIVISTVALLVIFLLGYLMEKEQPTNNIKKSAKVKNTNALYERAYLPANN